MKIFRIWLALAAASVVCGCTVGPDYQFPEVAIPAVFGSASREIVAQNTAPQPDALRWWETLHDPVLTQLVAQAISCNPDIDIAITRMQAVRTQQIVVIGSSLPTVEAAGGIGAGTGTDLTKGRVPNALRAGTNNAGLTNISRIAGFDTGWELDLWGKYRRQLEAVRDDAQAYAEVRNAVLISVVAEIVRNYVDLRGFQLRLQIAENGVRGAQKTVDVAQERFNRGLTNELDVTLAKRELASVQAAVPQFQAGIAHAESRLAELLGTFSSDIAAPLRRPRPLPHLPVRIKAGVPADLLRRRPDIRESERQLAGATARIGVATANLFPTVSFTAGIGVQGGEASTSKSAAAPLSGPIWSAGPGGYWPLFDFGRLDALIDIEELAAHEALVNYKRTIVNAVEEVDDALNQYRAQQLRLSHLLTALEQSRKSVTLARERYERGLTDFLYVLDAQRQEFAIEDQTALARESAVIQYVALYKALGGGWELYSELPPLKAPLPALVATAQRLTNDWH
jgi:NodT family efflux transporter outer membrane factor (OMF) lipoprotein